MAIQSVRKQIIIAVVVTVAATAVLMIIGFAFLVRSSENSVSTADYGSGGMPVRSFAPMPSSAAGVSKDYAAPNEIMPPQFPGAGAEDRAGIEPKIVRNGSLALRVDDVNRRLNEAKTIAKNLGGFAASTGISEDNGQKKAEAVLRVPAAKFDELILSLKNISVLVLDESTQSEDVTDAFIDLEARLKAAQEEETQYLAILKKAVSIEETLNVTQRLADVRSRIERMQGEKRYMADRTDYATLNVSFVEEARIQIPERTWRPLESIKQVFRGLVSAFQYVIDFLAAALIYGIGLVLPLAILARVAYGLLRRLWRKLFRKN